MTDPQGVCNRKGRLNADETPIQIMRRICHSDIEKGGCEFFGSKPENVPEEYLDLIEEAEYMRRLRLRGFEKDFPRLSQISALTFAAFDESEQAREDAMHEPQEAEAQPSGEADSKPRAAYVRPRDPASPFANWFPKEDED